MTATISASAGDSLSVLTAILKHAREIECENARLRELGAELRRSAGMIGHVQSADDWRNAERRIKAWEDFLANTAVRHAEDGAKHAP